LSEIGWVGVDRLQVPAYDRNDRTYGDRESSARTTLSYIVRGTISVEVLLHRAFAWQIKESRGTARAQPSRVHSHFRR
jgi:hypothetical protein